MVVVLSRNKAGQGIEIVDFLHSIKINPSTYTIYFNHITRGWVVHDLDEQHETLLRLKFGP